MGTVVNLGSPNVLDYGALGRELALFILDHAADGDLESKTVTDYVMYTFFRELTGTVFNKPLSFDYYLSSTTVTCDNSGINPITLKYTFIDRNGKYIGAMYITVWPFYYSKPKISIEFKIGKNSSYSRSMDMMGYNKYLGDNICAPTFGRDTVTSFNGNEYYQEFISERHPDNKNRVIVCGFKLGITCVIS